MSYADYLKTDHWKHLAAETRRLAGNRCQVCNSPERLEIHHRTYERKGDEFQSDLVCLCHECHEIFHLYKDELEASIGNIVETFPGLLETRKLFTKMDDLMNIPEERIQAHIMGMFLSNFATKRVEYEKH